MIIRKTQNSFTAGELAPALYGRLDLAKYEVGCKRMRNMVIHPHGGASNRAGTQYVADAPSHAKKTRVVPFTFNRIQAYILVFGHQTLQIIKDGGVVVTGSPEAPVAVTTPYVENDIFDLHFAQSADVLYITHPSYAPRKLSRSSHIAWTLSTVAFGAAIAAPTNVTGFVAENLEGAARSISYKVSALAEDGREGLPSSTVTVTVRGNEIWNPGGKFVRISWDAVAGASKYVVYKDYYDAGIFGYIGLVDASEATSFKDGSDLKPEGDDNVQEARDPFSGSGNYPSTVCFHQQRVVYGGTNNAPSTFNGSRISEFDNFNVSSPTKADDAYTFTLVDGQVNSIEALCSLKNLIIFTGNAAWVANSGEDKGAITPNAIDVNPQTYYGASGLQAVVVGSFILYVERDSRSVRALGYALDIDGYKGTDLGVLSPHLFDGYEIVDWAYAQTPDSIVWMVRDDGKLISLTYMPEHEVVGMALHETDGLFESVATIPGDGYTEVYFSVVRTVGGSTKRYIERMLPRISDKTDTFTSYFVDCGLTYEGAAATTISGLDHLEGKTVSILANGAVVPQQVVTSGEITLPFQATTVHAGLPYESTLETLDLNHMLQDGATLGRHKSVSKVMLRMENTVGCSVGCSDALLDEVRMRDEVYSDDPPPLYTGDKEVSVSGGSGVAVNIIVKQTQPIPMTILAITTEVNFSER